MENSVCNGNYPNCRITKVDWFADAFNVLSHGVGKIGDCSYGWNILWREHRLIRSQLHPIMIIRTQFQQRENILESFPSKIFLLRLDEGDAVPREAWGSKGGVHKSFHENFLSFYFLSFFLSFPLLAKVWLETSPNSSFPNLIQIFCQSKPVRSGLIRFSSLQLLQFCYNVDKPETWKSN